MNFINTILDFVGSGKIRAGSDSVHFYDTYITDSLPVSETGQAALDSRYVAISILGALNELIDGLYTTSGNASQANTHPVTGYVTGVDTAAFVHTITHNLGTFDVTVDMYNMDPSGFPGVAQPVIVCYSPTSSNAVRVELDAAASGHFIVTGYKYRV